MDISSINQNFNINQMPIHPSVATRACSEKGTPADICMDPKDKEALKIPDNADCTKDKDGGFTCVWTEQPKSKGSAEPVMNCFEDDDKQMSVCE